VRSLSSCLVKNSRLQREDPAGPGVGRGLKTRITQLRPQARKGSGPAGLLLAEACPSAVGNDDGLD